VDLYYLSKPPPVINQGGRGGNEVRCFDDGGSGDGRGEGELPVGGGFPMVHISPHNAGGLLRRPRPLRGRLAGTTRRKGTRKGDCGEAI